jgi:DNA-binding CsgD family transcriptional regulator
MPGEVLRGRDMECEALRGLLATTRSGASRVLVLRGEAGVGKTALLQHVLAHADGFRVTRVAGIESDMELAFAGLQQLCTPLLDRVDALPAPQREALDVAFGLGAGPTPDRFLVGLAVLSLLAAAADAQPVLCVIDDVQWLDEVSVQTLGFVARRLLAEPVAVVFALRDGGATVLPGLPEMPIGGLSDSGARELLDSVMLGRLDERVRDRIIAETRGIPLALLELHRTLSAAELAGGFAASGNQHTAGQLEERFVQRIRALPAETQRLILTAAAEPVGDAALFLRAAAYLGIPVDALAPAEDAGIIEFGPRMRFHHPLMRSAAYRAADVIERRAVHRALAAATDPRSDPDRRAWHAANAASGPDDKVAADLETSAERAQGRGGIAAAAAFLERAAVLTSDPSRRGSRALAAAQAKCDAAAPEVAHELLLTAELCPLSDLQRAHAKRLRAQLEFARSRGGEAGSPRIGDAAAGLLDAARRLDGLDDMSARETYLEALAASMFAARCGDPGALARAAVAARTAVAKVIVLDRPIDLLLRGITDLIIDGLAAGRDPLRSALNLWGDQAQRNDAQALRMLSLAFPIVQESAAAELWDDDVIHRTAGTMVGYARGTGALAILPATLAFRAGMHVLSGEFSSAANLLEEADAISAATNHRPMKYHRLHLAAWRGVHSDAVGLIEAATAEATHKGEGRLLGVSEYCAAILHNGLGRYDEAFAAAGRAAEHYDLGFGSWCLTELVEAAVQLEERETARQAVHDLELRVGASGTNWGLGALARAQALLADDESADQLFREAITRLENTRVVSQLARTHLSYGEWLRRANRRGDARRQLSVAHGMFIRMGALAFADRARKELVATGEKVRKQPVASGDELTAQEAQIARLAADGLTNQEIGAQLFISTHTVEWHLRKVFVKLGVSSRRQLRTVSWPD